MSEERTVEDSAVDLMDGANDAIQTFSEKLSELAVNHGDAAIDLALTAARIDAMSSLVPAIVMFAISGGVFLRMYSKLEEPPKNGPDTRVDVTIVSAVALAGVVLSTFLLFDPWKWYGVFYPELWLAKQVLGF